MEILYVSDTVSGCINLIFWLQSSYLNTYSGPSSPLDSPSQNLHSPTSSQGSIGSPGRDGSSRDRRVGHIHAEQKRRCNIKYGFDMLHSLIPQLNQNPNAKVSYQYV